MSSLTHKHQPGVGAARYPCRNGGPGGGRLGSAVSAGVKLWESFLGLGSSCGLRVEAWRVFWGQLPLSSSFPLPSALFLQYKDNIIVFLNIKIHALCKKKVRQYKSLKTNIKIIHNLPPSRNRPLDILVCSCSESSMFARMDSDHTPWIPLGTSHFARDHGHPPEIAIDQPCHLTCFHFWAFIVGWVFT